MCVCVCVCVCLGESRLGSTLRRDDNMDFVLGFFFSANSWVPTSATMVDALC